MTSFLRVTEGESAKCASSNQIVDFKLAPTCTLYVMPDADLTKMQVDVIANSVGGHLNLSNGVIAPAILAAAGLEIQAECKRLYPNGIKVQEIAITSGFKLKCQQVFHFNCPSWVEWEGKSENEVKNMMIHSLQMADNKGYRSIAFPALASQTLNYPEKVVARMMLSAAQRFGPMAKNLQTVNIVIHYSKDTLFKEFADWIVQEKRMLQQDEQTDAQANYKMQPLNRDNSEFKEVLLEFLKTAGSGWQVSEILKTTNDHLYELYEQQKSSAQRKSPVLNTNSVERRLWHATKEDNVKRICREGFEPGLAERNVGAIHGRGSYFAVQASYSVQDQFAVPNKDGERFLIFAKAITGKFCKGEPQHEHPPPLPEGGGNYDSVADDPSAPSIFVLFSKYAAYPEYVIKFKRGI